MKPLASAGACADLGLLLCRIVIRLLPWQMIWPPSSAWLSAYFIVPRPHGRGEATPTHNDILASSGAHDGPLRLPIRKQRRR